MKENINPYNETVFRETFKNTEIYKKLKQDFGEENLIWNKFFSLTMKKIDNPSGSTPREKFSTCFSMAPFYYLLPLLEKDYDTIYDLGCGKNVFKSYLPRLTGVGAERMHIVDDYSKIKDPAWPDISNKQDFENLPGWIKEKCEEQYVDTSDRRYNKKFYGDIDGFVDDKYVFEHQNYFQAVFSINALHYHPLNLLKKTILDFVSMVKIGGRGFLTLNLQRLIERTPEHFLVEKFSTNQPTKSQYEEFVRNELKDIDLNFLIVDIDLIVLDEGINGNIRLVFEK